MSTLLTYAINTIPNMLTAGTTGGVLILMATNNGKDTINIKGISLTIPTGTSGNELTAYPAQIQHNIPAGWKAESKPSAGNITFVFTPSQQAVSAGSNVTFTLSNIKVNANQGTVELIVAEGSTGNPTLQFPVSKFPADWGIVGFSTVPSNLPAPGAVVLKWNGPSGASYSIQYMDTVTGQIYNLPAPGEPVFSNSGTYPGISDPPLTVSATTFFTLTVTATIGGIIYQSQVTLPVTVYVPPPPPPSMTSLSGSMGISTGGSRVLNLVWTSENDDHVEGDWTADTMDRNVYASAPKPVYPPFKNSYSVFAVTATQQSAAKTINLEWKVLSRIAVGENPSGIVMTADGSKLFVNNMNGNTVSVIDAIKQQLIQNIPVGSGPTSIAIAPNGQYVVVGNMFDNSISVIDVAGLNVINTIPISNMGFGLAFTPDSNYVLVGAQGVHMLNIQTGEDQIIEIGSDDNNPILKFAATSDGKYSFGIYDDSNNQPVIGKVAVINLAQKQFIKNIPVGPEPMSFALSPDGQFAYIVSFGNHTIAVIDIRQLTLLNTINLQSEAWPVLIKISPDGGYALVANSGNYTFSVINIKDPSAAILTFDLNEQEPDDIIISPDGTRAFISTATETGAQSGYVWFYNFSKAAMEATFQVGSSANEMAISADSQILFVVDKIANVVSAFGIGISS